jgi:hypothetical protein
MSIVSSISLHIWIGYVSKLLMLPIVKNNFSSYFNKYSLCRENGLNKSYVILCYVHVFCTGLNVTTIVKPEQEFHHKLYRNIQSFLNLQCGRHLLAFNIELIHNGSGQNTCPLVRSLPMSLVKYLQTSFLPLSKQAYVLLYPWTAFCSA